MAHGRNHLRERRQHVSNAGYGPRVSIGISVID
jgi:hypothetical protein